MRTSSSRATAVFAATILLVIASLAPACRRSSDANQTGAGGITKVVALRVTETPLGVVPAGLKWNNVSVSPDARRVAYAAQQGDKWLVAADGASPRTYDAFLQQVLRGFTLYEEGTLLFSPNSKRVVHAGRRGQSWFVVVDQAEYGPYDEVRPDSVAFSRESAHVAYAARLGKNWLVAVDGSERGRSSQWIGDVALAPDGSRLAYVARDGDRARTVLDGKPGDAYDHVFGPLFSPDGQRLVYPAKRGDQWFVVTNGVPGPPFEELSSWEMYSDGAGNRVTASTGGPPVFSADGKHLAYTAKQSGQWHVIVDGQPSQPYGRVGRVAFSAHGSTYAYGAYTGGKGFAVVNGVPGKAHEHFAIDSVVLSPDGTRHLYVAARAPDKSYVVVVDGVEGKEHDATIAGSERFSPNGKRTAYVARRGKNMVVVVDGADGTEYENVRGPWFAPDGSHVACFAKKAGSWHIVVDGVESPGVERVADPNLLVFESPVTLRTVAVKGGAFVGIQVRLEGR